MRIRPGLLAATTICLAPLLLPGCDEHGVRYGDFSYSPPAGWAQHVPPPAISYGDDVYLFTPGGEREPGGLVLEIREVTDGVPRDERIPELYAYARERMWSARAAQAARDGQPGVRHSEVKATPVLPGDGEAQAYAFEFEQGGVTEFELVNWTALPDGRRFRARFTGSEPAFSAHKDAVMASLAGLRFVMATAQQPALTRAETIAALADHLDGDRLWITDGKLRGRVLNDAHLAALSDPMFANVTDFNVNPTTARIDGVEVTDIGLRHLVHLPLETLCLRGSLVTDAGLESLRGLPLKQLVLDGTLVEGDGLRHLAGMNLRVLDLAGTRVDDDALQHLAGAPLAQLWLRGTRVTDAGVETLESSSSVAHVVR